MKKIGTKIVRAVIATALVLFSGSAVMADTVTLAVGAGYPATQSYQVPSNTVAQVTYSYLRNTSYYITALYVSFPQASNSPIPFNGGIIVGPATITLTTTNGHNDLLCLCTIQTSPAISTLNFTPSTAVVIPNDNGGPVTIVLESSTDLVSWTPALPGTYGTTSSNRFFRVRAQR